MSPVLVLSADEVAARGPQWRKVRDAGIGGSEIAAVLGISPWESPFSLYWRKREGWWDTDETGLMSYGRRLEDVIAEWWADENDPLENMAIHPAGMYRHSERPWQFASPDRLMCDPQTHDNPFPDERPNYEYHHPDRSIWALLECKWVAHSWDGWGPAGSDDIPVHYRAQCLWQLDVMGVDEVHVAALGPGGFRAYGPIRRDEKDLRIMRAAGQEFMARLESGDPPDVDAHTATLATLRQLHPDVDDRDQDVSAATAEGYRRARAWKKRAQDACDRFEARLRAEMGDARRAVHDGATVATRSVYERAGYEVKPCRIDKLNPPRSPK